MPVAPITTDPPPPPPPANVLSVPTSNEERRPSIELIPALCDIGRSTAVSAGDVLLASEEDSMSEADSPSGLDDHSEEAWSAAPVRRLRHCSR